MMTATDANHGSMTSLGLWFFFLSFHSLIANNYFKLLTTATATRGATVTQRRTGILGMAEGLQEEGGVQEVQERRA